MLPEKSERFCGNRKTSPVGCMSWLSTHLLRHRPKGKSAVTSSSWSDDDSDSNDAAMTSYRDVTSRGPQVPPLQLSTNNSGQSPPPPPPSSPISGSSPSDVFETFDVYYVLPPPGGQKFRQRGPPPPLSSRWTGTDRAWDRYGEPLTLFERRRPNASCLLDAVPPTPGCYNDRRAATLPTSIVNGWASPSPNDFEHYKIPASATYSRPRCACLACSDLSPSATCNDVGVLYRQPTSTMWCGDDVGDLYYNSNEVDVDHLHRGCSCFGSQSRLTARQQGRPLLQAGSALTASATANYDNNYDAVPTPLPLNYANVRFCRQQDSSAQPQYSVPVRLTDSGAIYDNQDTLGRPPPSRTDRRAGHLDARLTTTASGGGHRQLSQVPVSRVDVVDGRIMRFVELRQVRAPDNREDVGQSGRHRRFRSEDRYLITPTVAEPITSPSHHHPHCGRNDKSEVVYVNVENAPTWATSASQLLPEPLLEEDTEQGPSPTDCEAATELEEQASGSFQENSESCHEERLNENGGTSCSVSNPDVCTEDIKQATDSDVTDTGNTAQPEEEKSDDCSSGVERCRPRWTTSDDGRARVRLADAYLLRMSPPPPSHQADARRRAAYSDPVRWISASSAADQRQQAQSTRRHDTSGLRPPAGNELGGVGVDGNGRKAAATICTNEALDEAIRRRNRKCKPSAMRRLQAAKAVGNGDPETNAASSPFGPIFEGVTCSLRARSASLSDCNALDKSRGHTLGF